MVEATIIIENFLIVTGLVLIGAYLFSLYFITTQTRRDHATVALLISNVIVFILAQFEVYNSAGFLLYLVESFIVIWIISSHNAVPKITEVVEPTTLDEKVRRDLGIGFVRTKRVQFPKWLNWVGGFMLPLFPAFYITNTDQKWVENNEEATVHELMHIKIIMQGFLFWMIIAPTAAYMLAAWVTDITIIRKLALVFGSVCVMVFNEYLTFKETAKYCEKNNIPCRPIRGSIFISYFIIYSIWLLLISIILRWLI